MELTRKMLSILHEYHFILNLNIFVTTISSMKRILIVPVLILLSTISLFAQGYKITLQTPNYTSGIAYLTYYYGKNINVEDSAVVNNKGIAVFQKKDILLFQGGSGSRNELLQIRH